MLPVVGCEVSAAVFGPMKRDELTDEGVMKACFDLHCHTHEGSPDSKISVETFIQQLIEQGFTGMMISDHDSYNGYRYYEEHLKEKYPEFTVLKGIEYDTLDAGHFLVVMPTGTDMKLFEHKGLSLRSLIRIVHRYGGVLGPAHPFGETFLSIMRTGRYRFDRSIVKEFDFLEGYNAAESDGDNEKAAVLARTHNLLATGGSDAHKIDSIGLAGTYMEEQVHNEDEFIQYVKEHRPMVPFGEHYFGTLKEKLGIWNKLLVYGFFPYNKVGAVYHMLSRRREYREIRHEMERALLEDNESVYMHVADLLEHDEVARMKEFVQHGNVSTLQHSLRVVIAADILARVMRFNGVDRKAMLRAAMLHDFYLYDWHHKDDGSHKWHGYIHAERARRNAVEHFDIGEKEQNIIYTHMWPLNITRLPRSREAWAVCLADKYVSTKETLFERK